MSQTGIVTDSLLTRHAVGRDHPEQPDRISVILNRLDTSGLARGLISLSSQAATDEQLETVHTPGYIQLVAREAGDGLKHLTPVTPRSAP